MDQLIDKTHGEGFTAEEVKNSKMGYVTGFYSKWKRMPHRQHPWHQMKYYLMTGSVLFV
jgi:hypothetical protein